MTKRLSFAILLFFICFLLSAQSENRRHVVKPGENVYRISLKYGVSMESIYKANPTSREKILVGETLIIPSGDGNYTQPTTYTVKYGDTKFSLARRFDMSITQLEQLNPQIKNMLAAGQVLKLRPSDEGPSNTEESVASSDSTAAKNTPSTAIESRDNSTQEDVVQIEEEVDTPSESDGTVAKPDDLSTNNKVDLPKPKDEQKVTKSPKIEQNFDSGSELVDYTVQAQETLYGLSKEADITISELLAINPQLKNGVKKGMVIKMPNPNFQGVKSDKGAVNYNTFTGTSIPDLIFTATKQDDNVINFHLPFTLKEYKDFLVKKDSSVFKIRENKKSIDFYQGATLAIKTINDLGFNFVANFYGNEKESVPAASNKVVLFPYLSEFSTLPKKFLDPQLEIINVNSKGLPENTKTYDALPSIELQRRTALEYIKKKRGNVIAISEIDRLDVRKMILDILDNPAIINVDENGQFDEDLVLSKLDKKQMNYVILDSEKSVLFLNATNLLLKSLSNYQINLVMIDKSLFPEEYNVSTKRFNILKTIYPSVNQVTTTPNQLKFKAQYKSIYGEEPTKEAVFGFDIAMDVMLRLSQNSTFEQAINTLDTRYLNLKFDYNQVNNESYQNNGVYMFQYNGYDKIDEIN